MQTRDASPDLSRSAVQFSAADLSPVPAAEPAATRYQRYRAEPAPLPLAPRRGAREPVTDRGEVSRGYLQMLPQNTALESLTSLSLIAVPCSVLLVKIQSGTWIQRSGCFLTTDKTLLPKLFLSLSEY